MAAATTSSLDIGFGNCGFGAMGMTAFYGKPMPADAALELLQSVYQEHEAQQAVLGTKFPLYIDTAEIYKTGNPMADSDEDIYNETMLAPFLASVPRESVSIATKYMPFKYGGGNCDYDSVKGSLTRSLARLGLDCVDVYYCHRIPSLEKAIEFAQSAQRLMEEGLLKGIGLSEISGGWLRQVHAVVPIYCIQQEWSLATRNLEEELLPVCAELNIGVVAYSPLSRNLLAGPGERPTDWRASLPRYSQENWDKNIAVTNEIKAMAEAKGVGSAQLCLAWIFYKAAKLGVRVMPIPGTTKIANAKSNITSTSVSITDEEATKLEELAGSIAGARGDEGYTNIGIEGQK